MILDEALVLVFGENRSFTGEPSAEFHLHGSRASIDAVLHALAEMPGLRIAEPGEFTRRALENNRLDLTQVEGLADLIEAETEAQRKQALRVLSGELGRRTEVWRRSLIRAAALLEATIDFVDEEVPVDVYPEVSDLLRSVSEALARDIAGAVVAERIRDGFEVAIVGPPNVGKSTLLNALAGRDAAITSEIAGTTRDVIEVRMDLRGLPVTFLDTAGLRETDDVVETLGIDRAIARASGADLRVILLDKPNQTPSLPPGPDDIILVGKADCNPDGHISGLSGQGVDALVERITETLGARANLAGAAVRERHRVAMINANASLGIARDRIQTSPELAEVIAEEIRSAIRALDTLLGRVDVEDLLGEIFSTFCIGK
jgi:tRNA modification GTPase